MNFIARAARARDASLSLSDLIPSICHALRAHTHKVVRNLHKLLASFPQIYTFPFFFTPNAAHNERASILIKFWKFN
jgi:hypothetical protein